MTSGRVKSFYEGKTLLVTGATGFIGRLMIAKLMRVGNLKEIVLLLRPKKGKTNEERLDKILTGFLFQEMEKFDANFRSKLRIVNGDLELVDLGISNDDREYVKRNVEVVIHLAATVQFDEKLNKAITINIRGVKNILDLAVECTKLVSLVHISTAYSNCPRSEIEEKFYPPPMDYRQAIQLLDFDDTQIDHLTEKLIQPWPNTYTFTKAISEDMIRQYQDLLPVAIVRPSIGNCGNILSMCKTEF
jgi:alcohol-forming fatty acyl-CoA reductase